MDASFIQDGIMFTITDLIVDESTPDSWTGSSTLEDDRGFTPLDGVQTRLHLDDGRIDVFTTDTYDASSGQIVILGKGPL